MNFQITGILASGVANTQAALDLLKAAALAAAIFIGVAICRMAVLGWKKLSCRNPKSGPDGGQDTPV